MQWPLAQWFSTGGKCALQGIPGKIWRHFWLSKTGGRVLLASKRSRPGRLLNILWCTGQPPPQKGSLVQNVNSTEGEKIYSSHTWVLSTSDVATETGGLNFLFYFILITLILTFRIEKMKTKTNKARIQILNSHVCLEQCSYRECA